MKHESFSTTRTSMNGKPRLPNHPTSPVTASVGTFMATLVVAMSLAGPTAAAPVQAKFSLNGTDTDALLNAAGEISIPATQTHKLQYASGGTACTNVEWFIKLEGEQAWNNFDHTKYAELKLYRSGAHQLKMTVSGYNNWLAFCFHGGEYQEKTVSLKVATPAYTQTKYPILLVPGVLGYGSINLILLQHEYFYGVANAINRDSDQAVMNVPLNPWQDTEARGAELATYILEFLNDPKRNKTHAQKVNLMAHSHGSTTARVAIRYLKELGYDNVASLTTIAGPHYGTPTADGAKIAMEDWGWTGDLMESTLIPGFQFLGDVIALLSGSSQYVGHMDLRSVLDDFTQDEMYHFNKKYPTVAVPPNGKYFLRAVVDPSVDVDEPTQAYGADLYDRYIAETQVSYDIVQSDGEVVSQPLVIDDGLGNIVDVNAPEAVQYYSFSGNGAWSTHQADLADYVLFVFNSFYGVVYNNRLGVPAAKDFIESDGFIPVSSAKFGKYIGTYYWNHLDEQNGLFGLIAGVDAEGRPVPSPKDVYRMHANRLQRAGL